MNINRIIFAIEDCISTLSRYSVSAFFPDYCDLHTVIGLDQQDRERRPWLKAPYIATTKQGYYLSVFEISGALKEMDENPDQTAPGTLESLIAALAERMNTAWKIPATKSVLFSNAIRSVEGMKSKPCSYPSENPSHARGSCFRTSWMKKSPHSPPGLSGSAAG